MSAYKHLKPEQREFVDRLVRRETGTAAMRAIKGPNYKNPDVKAAQWRANPVIREALAEREAEAMIEAGITNAQVLLDIASIGNFSIKSLQKADGTPKAPHELSDEDARVVESVEFKGGNVYRYRIPSRLEAKKLLGAHLKLFVDRREISGPEGTPIGVEYSLNDLGRRIAFAMVHGLETSQGSADRAQTQAAGSPPQASSTDTDDEE